MKIQKSREIIIEYERIQIIRKRAATKLDFCQECRTTADFIFFNEAATLFNTKPDLLFQFIKDTGSHYQTGTNGEFLICLDSLLTQMKAKIESSEIQKGEEKNEIPKRLCIRKC